MRVCVCAWLGVRAQVHACMCVCIVWVCIVLMCVWLYFYVDVCVAVFLSNERLFHERCMCCCADCNGVLRGRVCVRHHEVTEQNGKCHTNCTSVLITVCW